MNEVKLSGKLVNAEQLLEALFTPEARPSMRWLRTQTKNKVIPFVRIGHLVSSTWKWCARRWRTGKMLKAEMEKAGVGVSLTVVVPTCLSANAHVHVCVGKKQVNHGCKGLEFDFSDEVQKLVGPPA